MRNEITQLRKIIILKNSSSTTLYFIAVFAIATTFSCSKKMSINSNYRGITNNPKVLSEGLKLNADKSYIFNYTIYDVGPYASNFAYIGNYEILNERIRFSLDTIKSFNSRVYRPNEERDDSPFSNHEIRIVDSELKKRFTSGELRLKPEYEINKSKNLIRERLQERFEKLD